MEIFEVNYWLMRHLIFTLVNRLTPNHPSSHHRRNAGVLAASSAADCRRYAVVIRLERRVDGVSVAYIRHGNES